MDKKIPNLPAGQMISTWRMSQEGLSLGNQILKEKTTWERPLSRL